jgi:hypothetical protein
MDLLNQLQAHWDDLLILIGAVGVAAEGCLAASKGLVAALRSLAGFAAMLALYTSTATDDRVIGKCIKGLDAAADWLDGASKWIPRLRAGHGRNVRASDTFPGGVVMLAIVMGVAASFGLSGCAHATKAARVSIEAGSYGLVAADVIAADEIERIANRCIEESESMPEWVDCTEPARRVRDALLTFKRTLLAAEAAVDATGQDGFARVAPCVARSLSEVAAAFEAAWIDLPEELRTLAGVVGSVGGQCREPEGE